MKKCKHCLNDFKDWRGNPIFCSKKCNFMGSYKIVNGCWIWRNANKKTGYGILNYHGQAISAHRYSYTIFKGPIPKKYEVCHTCDVRNCVNPEHLFLGTKSDNMQDCLNKKKFSNGEKHYAAKITEENVKQIRLRRSMGEKIKNIANDFGISISSVCDLDKRRTWKHV